MKTPHDFYAQVIGKRYDIDGAYGAQCPIAGTLIEKASGSYVPVEQLEPGDILKGGNIVVSNNRRKSRVLHVETKTGHLFVSPTHRFIMSDGSEKAAEELEKGDEIKLDSVIEENAYPGLTIDELKFFGLWLADGTKKYRWENSSSPEIFVTVGTDEKIEYVKSLGVSLREHKHSNKKAKAFTLVNARHPHLVKIISETRDKDLRRNLTPIEFGYVLEGFSEGDGYGKGLTNTNKKLLLSLQYGCIINGWSAKLSLPIERTECQVNRYCKNPKPIYHLTVNQNKKPEGKVIRVTEEQKGDIYILNVDGDHTYYAENHKYHNCWDGAMYYSQWLGYPVYHCGLSGYAKDIWNQRKTSGILTYYQEVGRPFQDGDIIVWDNCSACPWSHIAIFRKDCGNGEFIALGENQGGAYGSFSQRYFTYDGVLGGLRPKCYIHQASHPTPEKKTKPKVLPNPKVVIKKPPMQAFTVLDEKGNQILKTTCLKAAREMCKDGYQIFDRQKVLIGDAKNTAVFRLYDRNSGHHLFTADPMERDTLAVNGWRSEGTGWMSPLSGDPVYRLYNRKTGQHLYTMDHQEHDNLFRIGWNCENAVFYSGSGTPVLRLYDPNGGHHMYTISESEADNLKKAGWNNEGIAFYTS